MSASSLNVFVPHVFPNFDEEYMTKAFSKIGVVDHMDFVSKQDRNGKLYNAVYIHFTSWHTNSTATKMRNALEAGEQSKLVYDTPWFWVVLPNKGQKWSTTDRKPRIDLDFIGAATDKPATEKPATEKPATDKPATDKPATEKPLETSKVTYAQIIGDSSSKEKKKVYPPPCARITSRSINIPTFNEEQVEEIVVDEYDAESSEDVANMAEMEDAMDALNPDAHLVSIDARYVQTLEHENWFLRNQVNELKQAIILMNYLSTQGIVMTPGIVM
jgi:hypothetical protein